MKRTFFMAAASSLMIASAAATAHAGLYITEWMYKGGSNGGSGEFVEFTDVGSTAVNLNGWSEDDSHETPGTHDLSAFGTVQPGESVILTEDDPTDFRTYWGLSSSVPVITYSNPIDDLGNGDEINLYDASNQLVDQLTYGKTPNTNNVSGNIPLADLGKNDAADAVLSTVGDIYGSYNANGTIGNPGIYTPASSVPEPASLAIFGVAGLLGLRRRPRRRGA
jgi:predicted extracellular nuclease